MFGRNKIPKVLIVEDDPNNHLLFRTAFEQAGFEVFLSQTAEGELASAVANLSPDIISMDLMIGLSGVEVKRDGFDAIALLKADPRTKQIPIMVVTNFSSEDKITEAKALGVVDYFGLQGQGLPQIAKRFKDYIDKPNSYRSSHEEFRS